MSPDADTGPTDVVPQPQDVQSDSSDGQVGTNAFCDAVKQKFNPLHIRGSYRGRTCGSAKECHQRHKDWTEFRTKNYGYFKKFGQKKWNRHSPSHYAERTTFMGRKVTLNKWVVAVLKCVESDLETSCTECKDDPEYPNECQNKRKKYPYKPSVLSGLRTRNTFRGGEVSNHVYGIAIDMDPASNTCCGCTARWRSHPLCKQRNLEAYERMIMPSCWITVFERYGFYWLGRNTLEDTMHFDFLGDPKLVERAVMESGAGQ